MEGEGRRFCREAFSRRHGVELIGERLYGHEGGCRGGVEMFFFGLGVGYVPHVRRAAAEVGGGWRWGRC